MPIPKQTNPEKSLPSLWSDIQRLIIKHGQGVERCVRAFEQEHLIKRHDKTQIKLLKGVLQQYQQMPFYKRWWWFWTTPIKTVQQQLPLLKIQEQFKQDKINKNKLLRYLGAAVKQQSIFSSWRYRLKRYLKIFHHAEEGLMVPKKEPTKQERSNLKKRLTTFSEALEKFGQQTDVLKFDADGNELETGQSMTHRQMVTQLGCSTFQDYQLYRIKLFDKALQEKGLDAGWFACRYHGMPGYEQRRALVYWQLLYFTLSDVLTHIEDTNYSLNPCEQLLSEALMIAQSQSGWSNTFSILPGVSKSIFNIVLDTMKAEEFDVLNLPMQTSPLSHAYHHVSRLTSRFFSNGKTAEKHVKEAKLPDWRETIEKIYREIQASYQGAKAKYNALDFQKNATLLSNYGIDRNWWLTQEESLTSLFSFFLCTETKENFNKSACETKETLTSIHKRLNEVIRAIHSQLVVADPSSLPRTAPKNLKPLENDEQVKITPKNIIYFQRLGFTGEEGQVSVQKIKANFRKALIKTHPDHPDRGGTDNQCHKLLEARNELLNDNIEEDELDAFKDHRAVYETLKKYQEELAKMRLETREMIRESQKRAEFYDETRKFYVETSQVYDEISQNYDEISQSADEIEVEANKVNQQVLNQIAHEEQNKKKRIAYCQNEFRTIAHNKERLLEQASASAEALQKIEPWWSQQKSNFEHAIQTCIATDNFPEAHEQLDQIDVFLTQARNQIISWMQPHGLTFELKTTKITPPTVLSLPQEENHTNNNTAPHLPVHSFLRHKPKPDVQQKVNGDHNENNNTDPASSKQISYTSKQVSKQ